MKSFEWTHKKRVFFGLKTEVDSPKFGLFVIHGMGEHMGRYHAFFKALEAQGIYALGIDLRGHGKSLQTRELGLLEPTDSFMAMLEDIHTLFGEETTQYPGVTWTLMGHSMGSVLARRYAQVYPSDFNRMIWMGTLPLYTVISRKAFRFLAGFFSLFYPAYGRNHILSHLLNQPLKSSIKHPKTTHDWLSKNPDNVQAFLADPLTGYAYNSRFYRMFFKTVDEICRVKNIQNTSLKRLLLIAGSEDPVTQNGKSHTQIEKVYARLFPDLILSSVTFDAMRHEPLNEKDPTPVYEAIIEEITHE